MTTGTEISRSAPSEIGQHPSGRLTFIDLFAGIGGMRLAFEGAGARCVFSSEWNKFAAKTYEANFGDRPAGDITGIGSGDIPSHDILLAGFPCQPFSIAGVTKHTALGNPHGFQHKTQGTLFFEVARILKDRAPRAFLLENVRNLVGHDRGRTFKTILTTLRDELGYDVHWQILDAAAILPQHRERVYIVGFSALTPFRFPELGPRQLTISKILEPSPDPRYSLTSHLWTYLQEYARKHRSRGNGFGFGLIDTQNESTVTRTLSARYYKDGSEILIPTAGDRPRRLTPRECARLMGFPDSFKIPVSDTQAYKQFGNSVAVPVVAALAKTVVGCLRGQDGLDIDYSAPPHQLKMIKERRKSPKRSSAGDGTTFRVFPGVARPVTGSA